MDLYGMEEVGEECYLSHAKCAHIYVLAISSSDFRLLNWLWLCARRELARSMSSIGSAPEWRGMRFSRAWRIGLLIL